jgi:hypothetical protein
MKRILLMMLIPILGLIVQANAQGNLLITPMRVVFEGNKHQAELNLMNTGTDTATYSISFRHYNMTEQGRLVLIEKPDTSQMLADPYLRIYPRQVTLAPGEPQVIMLQFRRKESMASGEYRSHLWFRSEKDYEALKKEKMESDSNQMSVTVIPIFGITIPVIIRTGNVNVAIAMSDLKLEAQNDSSQILKFILNRTGNISTHGDIKIDFIPAQGKAYQVGALVGVSVYTNLIKRNVEVKLKNVAGTKLVNGKLKVQYVSNGDSKRVVMAEAELNL